jgi:hypothetical protein
LLRHDLPKIRKLMKMVRLHLLPWILSLAVSCHANPRDSSSEETKQRELRGQRFGGDRGGAGGQADPKTQVRQDPIVLGPAAMPKALSDHTATEYNGLIYIAGGCDSPNGYQLNAASGVYACTSLSNSFYSFDPFKQYGMGVYTTLPNLPRPRYRHSSVALNDEVWLIGGRDVDDNLLSSVDVSFSFPAYSSLFVLPRSDES